MRKKKQTKNIKKYFVIGMGLIFSVVLINFVFKDGHIPHQNTVDTKISLYSDKHITPKAIETNPAFKNIVFDTPPKEKNNTFSHQIATVFKSLKSVISQKEKTEKSQREYGSWVWTPIMQMTPEYTEEILSESKTNGINVIYLSLDSYLDIFVMEKGSEREKQKKLFSTKVEDFIVRAIYKAFAIINYVKSFNATHQNKFRGFQYDVEPYLLEEYPENTTSILRNFVELVDKTA